MKPRRWITITAEDGTVLDRFLVSHWRDERPDDTPDMEAYGSPASEGLLMHRIREAVTE